MKSLYLFRKSIFFLIFLFVLPTVSYSQDTDSDTQTESQASETDPMNKPTIWVQLQKKPNDQTLWETYLGKKILDFTEEDNQNIALWQEQLMVLQSEHAEIVITSTADTDAQDKETLRDMQVADWENMEEVVMSTGSEIQKMRQNIDTNFALLEDLYADAFKEQGLEYTSYYDKYPQGNYSKVKWIETQEEILMKSKLKELQAIRKQTDKN